MEHRLTHPAPLLSHAYQHLLEAVITILLMMGAFPIFKDVLVYILMKLHEIFIQHQYLF
jgi:hypothetical protein